MTESLSRFFPPRPPPADVLPFPEDRIYRRADLGRREAVVVTWRGETEVFADVTALHAHVIALPEVRAYLDRMREAAVVHALSTVRADAARARSARRWRRGRRLRALRERRSRLPALLWRGAWLSFLAGVAGFVLFVAMGGAL